MTDTRRLLADEGGAILVTGLFASAFLVGALWYVLGVGDALLFRERMQDGADAVAFATSVVHARGMNLIALMNLTMASLLAVFVAVKIVQALLVAANIVACLICAASLGTNCADCEYLSEHEHSYREFVKKVDRAVADLNSSLHDTSDAIAREMPVLAARRGIDAGRAYAPMVEGAFAVSVSLVPGSSDAGTLGGSTEDTRDDWNRGRRLGLPVEDDDYGNLCAHSGAMMSTVFVPVSRRYDDGHELVRRVVRYAGQFVEVFLRRNPHAWCGGNSDGGGHAGFESPAHPCGTGKHRNAKCAEGLGHGLSGLASESTLGQDRKTSKRMYAPARHGDDYFATWGFTESRFIETDTRGERGTEVATWGQAPEGAALPQGDLDRRLRTVQVAKSEFFYDPRKNGPREWDELRDEGLWNLRWRARLRRVSQPNGDLRGLFAGSGLSSIESANPGSGADVRGVVRGLLSASPEQLSAWSGAHVGPVNTTKRTGGMVH